MPVIVATNPPPTAPTSALLDLIGGQRQSTFRFWLCDIALNRQRELTVSSGGSGGGTTSIPTIANSTTQAVKRTLTNLEILELDDSEVIDTLNSRMEVEMLLSDGTVWPCGVFLFTANNKATHAKAPARITRKSRRHAVHDWGAPLLPTLTDQVTVLAQQASTPVQAAPDSLVTDVLIGLLANFVLPRGATVAASDARTGADAAMVWAPGADYYTILTNVSAIAGFTDPYFDNTGVLRIGPPRATTPGTAPNLSYSTSDRIITDSLVYSNDILDTPNRYTVVDSSATPSSVFASYDLPSSDPASAASRGYVITTVLTPQAVGSTANALAMAEAAAAAHHNAETLTFFSPPDPRHDTFDTVEVLGNLYRETGWSMPLKEGEPMSHTLTRSYG